MHDFCYALNEGEILNESHPEWPLFKLIICGSKIETLKISKRIMCTLKHMPLRLQVFYEHNTEKCIEMGGGADPSVFWNNKLLFEGLIQAEKIKEIFEKLLKGETMIKYATPKGNKAAKITLDEFIEKFNNNKAVLLDIRMPFEKKIWNIPFAIDISADELEERINELPKDKLIVVACPTQNRSPFAAMFLIEKGFDAKYLEGGFLALVDRLRGGKAKELKL